MADVQLVPPTGQTMDVGTAAESISEVVISGSVKDPAGDGATPAQMKAAVTHAGTIGNPHGTTANQVGADPVGSAAAAVGAHTSAFDHATIQSNASTGAAHAGTTGNPHGTSAADVGADPAGTASAAVAAHVGASDPHTQYQKESEKGAAGGYAELDGSGKVPSSQIPAIAISEFLGEVASESAMLDLRGEKGDWCIRTDLGVAEIIIDGDGSLLANWKAMPTPTAPVLSVNGETGAVVLDAADVGADPAGTAAAAVAAHVGAADPHTQYVEKAGDTMTGTLTFDSDAGLQMDVDQTAPAHGEGKVFWDAEHHCLAFFNEQAGVTLQVGQETFVRGRNSTGATLLNGRIVYVSGSTGSRPNFTLATNTDAAIVHKTLGVMTHDLANNSDGYATISGLVNDLDTAGMVEGDPIYLATGGQWTQTLPVWPAHRVRIGYCIRAHATQGRILVAIQQGIDLGEIDDVDTGSAATGDILRRLASGVWQRSSVLTDLLPNVVKNTGGTVIPGKIAVFSDTTGRLIEASDHAPGDYDLTTVNDLRIFGDGSDGDVTVSTSITLSRDMYYNNLTIAAGGDVNAGGYRIFVKQILDLSACSVADCIRRRGTAGGTASGATGGGNGSGAGAQTVGGGGAGANGGNGTTATGTQGGAGTAQACGNGGASGASGKGGTSGTSQAGSAARGSNAVTTSLLIKRVLSDLLRGATLIGGGSGAGGGGCGGGDGTNAGGGGGGSGGGSGTLFIAARQVTRSSSQTVPTLSTRGSNGGNGAAGVAGNAGGGGGGGAGGGGFVYLIYRYLTGTACTNMIDCSGGTGGNGGAGAGTGAAGDGGNGGAGGSICSISLTTGTITGVETVAGSAASGSTGGAGGAVQMTL